MKTYGPLILISLLALGTACEPPAEQPPASDADAWADAALPDDRIRVALPTDDEARAIGATAEGYLWTRSATQDVNGLIDFVLTTVDTITDFEPTYSSEDNEYFWGPWDDGGLDPNVTGLYVHHDETAGTYAWALIQRPKESTSDEDWVPIVAGETTPGDEEGHGEGYFVIDFDAHAALNPVETTRGRFMSTYTLDGDQVVAEAAFEAFSEDGGATTTNAVYRYQQDSTGAGSMDLGLEMDIEDEGDAKETVVLRTRWQGDGQGRADMVIFGGDLGDFLIVGSQCWDSAFLSVYEENNIEGAEGDLTLCAFQAPEWNEDAPEAP